MQSRLLPCQLSYVILGRTDYFLFLSSLLSGITDLIVYSRRDLGFRPIPDVDVFCLLANLRSVDHWCVKLWADHHTPQRAQLESRVTGRIHIYFSYSQCPLLLVPRWSSMYHAPYIHLLVQRNHSGEDPLDTGANS